MLNKNIEIAGQVLHLLLDEIGKMLKPGIDGNDINSFAEDCINNYSNGCTLACKGYQGFPASLCVSVNEEIVHGVPSNKIFKDGDIVKVDIVIEYNGWFADSARTFLVGKGTKQSQQLIKTTKQCLYKAIKVARIGNTTGDIGYVIQQHAIRNGFSVMKEYTGHGIGQVIHKEPSIPCFGVQKAGYKLKEGDIICIEPMLFIGKPDIERGKDEWNVKSKDNSLTAHFEHTVLITKNSPLILT